MPYKSIAELPASVKNNLPEHAQEIFLAAYNHAATEYLDPEKRRNDAPLEEVARRVAWGAVERVYAKDPISGKWVKK